MLIDLYRHGETQYNKEARYQGRGSDIPLGAEGRRQLKPAGYPVGRVYTSALARAKETTAILFPGAELVEVPGLAEMDFGAFEGRSYKEMEHDPDYRAWVDGGCLFPCPGGAPLGLCYKAVNTMDSMVGYKNDKYLYFGRAAAKLDDFANFIPARLSAFLLMAGAALTGQSAKGAFRIWRRDKRKHASPNSAQTEAAMAGALSIQLAGPASYFGKPVDKATIGDPLRPVEPEDILRANRILYVSGVLCLLIFGALRLLIGVIV